MQLNNETHPDLFYPNGNAIEREYSHILGADTFIQKDYNDHWVNAYVFKRPDNLYLVEVFDRDLGGDNVVWVSELYDNEVEAVKAYQSRCREINDADGDYINAVWCDQ